VIDASVGTFKFVKEYYQPGCRLCSLKVAPTRYWGEGKYIDMNCKVTFFFFPCEATAAPEILGDPK
jgi:hypothetical protein